MQAKSLRNNSMIAIATILVMTFVLTLTFSTSTTVEAQFEEPTATPRDPVWLAFSAARDAVEEQEEINLEIVQRWDFWQDDWSTPNANHPENAAGIDSCDSVVGIAQGRPIYFCQPVRRFQ